MKIIRKICMMFMSLSLCVFCFSMAVYAEDGRIMFSDSQTAVGEMVEVKCMVSSASGNIGDVEITMTYDNTYLQFDSGDGVTASGDRTLIYRSPGGVSSLSFSITFQALREGMTEIEITDASIFSDSGTMLTMGQGQSNVEIVRGDSSKDKEAVQVEVEGKTYTLADEFAEAEIPSGYVRTQVDIDGQLRQMAIRETSGVILGYLLDAEGRGDFFLYNESEDSFDPYEEIAISDTTSIVVLSDTSQVNLPSAYEEMEVTLNGEKFPIWQDPSQEGKYVLYGINNNGETGYYQYDPAGNTYQKFEAPTTSSKPKEQKDHPSVPILIVLGGAGILLVLCAIGVLITAGMKSRRQNAESLEPRETYCGNCGAQLPEGAKFCGNCGHRIG